MAHRTSSVLSAFRSATRSSIRTVPAQRFFTPSAFNMVQKAYFDIAWTGPEVTVDNNGNVTNMGSVKGKQSPPRPCQPPLKHHLGNTVEHPLSISIANLPVQQSRLVASTSSSSTTLLPRPLRTSVPSALARRALATRAPSSTVSSPSSCSREVTSPVAM